MIYLARRFAAFYVDAFIVMIIFYIINIIYSLSQGYNIIDIETPSGIQTLFKEFMVLYLYFSFFEFFFGRTPGKKLFKFKIIDFPQRLGFKKLTQVLKRNLVRLFPLDPFSIFLNEEYRMWHDIVSKTRVIDVRKTIESTNGI